MSIQKTRGEEEWREDCGFGNSPKKKKNRGVGEWVDVVLHQNAFTFPPSTTSLPFVLFTAQIEREKKVCMRKREAAGEKGGKETPV